MPEVGSELEKGDQLTVLESVKAVAEVYTSLSGKVAEVNSELENSPNLINDDPLGKGMVTSQDMMRVCISFLFFLLHPPPLLPSM